MLSQNGASKPQQLSVKQGLLAFLLELVQQEGVLTPSLRGTTEIILEVDPHKEVFLERKGEIKKQNFRMGKTSLFLNPFYSFTLSVNEGQPLSFFRNMQY